MPRLHPFFRLLICLMGAVAATILVEITVAQAIGTAARLNNFDPAEQSADFSARMGLLTILVAYIPILAWIWFCRKVLDRRSFASLGFRSGRATWQLMRGIVGGAGAVALVCGVLWLLGALSFEGLSNQTFDANPLTVLAMLAAWGVTFGMVGFMEELAFRGYALHNLHAWMGARAAVFFQALLFALIHLDNVVGPIVQRNNGGAPTPAQMMQAATDIRWGLLNIFLIGIFFALCFWKTGSLWFPIGFHASWNFFLGCIFSLPVSGIPIFRLFNVSLSNNTLLTGGDFGAEGSVLLTPLLLALIYLTSRAPDHPQALLDLNLLKIDLTPAPLPIVEPLPTPVIEAEPNRVNRFKTAFGSSIGYDEEPLALGTLDAPRSSFQVDVTTKTDVTDTPSEVAAPVEVAPVAVAPIVVVEAATPLAQPIATPTLSTPILESQPAPEPQPIQESQPAPKPSAPPSKPRW